MLRPYLRLHAAILLFGFSGILGDLILLPPTLLVFYRVLIAATAMLVLWANRTSILPVRGNGRLYAMGVVLCLHWLAFFGSIQAANVSVAVVCLAGGALFGTVIEALTDRRRPPALDVLLGVVALLGMYLLYSFHEVYGLGILLGLVSALFSAIYGVGNKPIMQKYSVHSVNFHQIGTCLLMLAPAVPVYGLVLNQTWHPVGMEWLYLVGLGVGCSVVANLLSLSALRDIPPFIYLLSFNLESVYSLILATWLLNENQAASWGEWAGMALVLGAVFAYPVLRSKRFQRKPRTETLVQPLASGSEDRSINTEGIDAVQRQELADALRD
jgi:drug/metabolite transporter (DMT)-like permease